MKIKELVLRFYDLEDINGESDILVVDSSNVDYDKTSEIVAVRKEAFSDVVVLIVRG